MTNEEAIKGLKNVSTMFTGYKPNEEMFAMAIKALETVSCIKEKCAYCPHCENCDVDDETLEIKALEQQEKTAAMTRYTDGLEEGIRCAMCTNPMANDRGCDGGCVVNESMYQNVLNVIKKHFLEQQPCDDCISRQAVKQVIIDSIADLEYESENREMQDIIDKLHPVTPKEKTGKWIEKWDSDHLVILAYECSKCRMMMNVNTSHYCPNCGARMVSE